MGIHHDAEIVFGLVIAELEEEQPDVWGDEWQNEIPDCLDHVSSGDSSEGWGELVLCVKGQCHVHSSEGGTKAFGNEDITVSLSLDECREIEEFCSKRGYDWDKASWLLVASRG